MSLESIANLNSHKETIKQRIREVKDLNLYHIDLTNIIEKMLSWEEENRPNFLEINEFLKQIKNYY